LIGQTHLFARHAPTAKKMLLDAFPELVDAVRGIDDDTTALQYIFGCLAHAAQKIRRDVSTKVSALGINSPSSHTHGHGQAGPAPGKTRMRFCACCLLSVAEAENRTNILNSIGGPSE
jgi:hypothetical protein